MSFGVVWGISFEQIDHTLQLRNTLLNLVAESPVKSTHLNFLNYASRATLDVIGAAGTYSFSALLSCIYLGDIIGFGYEINAIELGEKNELAAAFTSLRDKNRTFSLPQILVAFFPILGYVVSPPPSLLPTVVTTLLTHILL